MVRYTYCLPNNRHSVIQNCSLPIYQLGKQSKVPFFLIFKLSHSNHPIHLWREVFLPSLGSAFPKEFPRLRGVYSVQQVSFDDQLFQKRKWNILLVQSISLAQLGHSLWKMSPQCCFTTGIGIGQDPQIQGCCWYSPATSKPREAQQPQWVSPSSSSRAHQFFDLA